MPHDLSGVKPFDIQACLRTINKGDQMSNTKRVDSKTCEHNYVKRRYKIVKNKTLNGFAECVLCGSWYDCYMPVPEVQGDTRKANLMGTKRRMRPIRKRKGFDDL